MTAALLWAAVSALTFSNGALEGRFDPETFALEVKDVRCGRVWKTLDDGLRPADGVAASVRAEANELVLEFAADAAAEVPERFLAAKPFAAEGNDRFFVPMGCGWSFPAEGWDFGEYVADWDMSRMRLYTGFMKMGCFAQYAESVAADGSLAQGAGYLAILETPVDAEVTFKARSNGRLGMGAEWRGERGRFGYARRIRFVFFDRATMGAMAARYRAEMDRRGYRVTFAEKAKRHPKLAERLKLLKGAPDVWYWTERGDKAAVAEELRRLGFGNMIFSTVTRHDLGAWVEPDEVKALAKVPGVLASEYDIVNDAMEPAMLPKIDAVRPHWPPEVWDRGDYVMDAKGEVARGWKIALKEDPTKPVIGCIRICAAKGPYYQRQRLEKRLAEAPYSARFYDVTGTGISECYHPKHPLTLRQSVGARRTMLGLPGREYGLVTGTEEGLECFVPECDYLEGNFSAYTWRVDGGRYMWKTYETSPKVMKYAIDPATRCPFWEMVFHDCVSTFWYWTDYNNRFLDTWWQRDALNAITGTAPMYLFTPEVFAAQKERLAASVKVAARTARETADALLVDYRWLSADRLVQESRFSNGVVVTVNFSETPRTLADGRTLAPHEVVYSRLEDRVAAAVAAAKGRPHPRLFADRAAFENVKRLTERDPLARRFRAHVRETARAFLDQPPIERKIEGRRMWTTHAETQRRLIALALAYRLEGDRAFLDRAVLEMKAVCAFADWNPSHFLDTAGMCLAVAIGYDWLYDDMDAASREEIRRGFVRNGLEPVEKGGFWVDTGMNWGQVCNAGSIAVALALLDDEEKRAADVVTRSIRGLPRQMAAYAPHGAFPEGPGYWAYATEHNAVAIELLMSVLGSDEGLSALPGFAETAAFIELATGPTGQPFNFSDNHPTRGAGPAIWWFARRFGRPDLPERFERAALEKALGTPGFKSTLLPLALLWMREEEGAPANALPLAWNSEGTNPFAVQRSGWGRDDLFVGLKAGKAHVSHGHQDIGSFVLDRDGVRWAEDIGSDNYHRIEQVIGMDLWDGRAGSRRWSVYRLGVRSHNTLMIGDEDQTVSGVAQVLSVETGALSRVTLDLTPAYASARRVIRRGEVLEGRGYRLTDTIEGVKAGTPVRWAMMTKADVAVEGDRVVLTRDGKRLVLTRKVPAGASAWKVEESPHLHEWEDANAGYRQLTFTVPFPSAGNLELKVTFTGAQDF